MIKDTYCRRLSSSICLYTRALIMPSSSTNGPTPKDGIIPQTLILPPPYFTVGIQFLTGAVSHTVFRRFRKYLIWIRQKIHFLPIFSCRVFVRLGKFQTSSSVLL